MKGKTPAILSLILLSLFIVSCSASRRLAKEKARINKADTAQMTVANDSLSGISAFKEKLYQKLTANRIHFTTFTGKMKVNFDNDKIDEQDITANIRIRKDSAIWINLSAMLGIEVARIMVTRDSIIIVNRLKKSVYRRGLQYAEQILHIPVNFTTLQDLFVGNPLYLTDTILNVTKTPSVISFTCIGDSLVNTTNVFANNYYLQQSHLAQQDTSRVRSCNITYGDYENVDSRNFSSRRKIFVITKNATDIDIDFTKADFDVPVSFPFSIPADYDEE